MPGEYKTDRIWANLVYKVCVVGPEDYPWSKFHLLGPLSAGECLKARRAQAQGTEAAPTLSAPTASFVLLLQALSFALNPPPFVVQGGGSLEQEEGATGWDRWVPALLRRRQRPAATPTPWRPLLVCAWRRSGLCQLSAITVLHC